MFQPRIANWASPDRAIQQAEGKAFPALTSPLPQLGVVLSAWPTTAHPRLRRQGCRSPPVRGSRAVSPPSQGNGPTLAPACPARGCQAAPHQGTRASVRHTPLHRQSRRILPLPGVCGQLPSRGRPVNTSPPPHCIGPRGNQKEPTELTSDRPCWLAPPPHSCWRLRDPEDCPPGEGEKKKAVLEVTSKTVHLY
ncbi:hypothetical protein NDU88_006347 [Pleurodeles waltl]|uniref:Uncharacterized protein n=1 Tax=Pleurodeles waltl TaxID=8319 RepID=A0AAV7X0W4_PLEWA|nr:hypothetical protein NDU88_006347 [Pleurodeles waltl]